jgi:hypothetical protein
MEITKARGRAPEEEGKRAGPSRSFEKLRDFGFFNRLTSDFWGRNLPPSSRQISNFPFHATSTFP